MRDRRPLLASNWLAVAVDVVLIGVIVGGVGWMLISILSGY